MAAARKLVVLDSNLVVSAFLNPEGMASLAMQMALDYFDVAASRDTLLELTEVLRRSKFDRYLAPQDRAQRLALYAAATRRFEVEHHVTDCADTKDNKFLSLALAARANVIVSGDKKHLIAMHPYHGIGIVGARGFVENFESYL